MTWRPANPGWGTGLDARRIELFKLAAPIFRRDGYRGATVKALAHACHLSPAALYHYFPSKAAFATCLLDRPVYRWETWQLDPSIDPLVQLGRLVDVAIEELPDYLLAFDLARQVGRPMGSRELGQVFQEGEDLFGLLILRVAPTLGTDGARELARRVLAILVAPHATGLDPEPPAVRARTLDLLRLHLASVGVDPGAFDRAVSAA